MLKYQTESMMIVNTFILESGWDGRRLSSMDMMQMNCSSEIGEEDFEEDDDDIDDDDDDEEISVT